MSVGQKLWYDVKGLVTKNTHVKYESPILCCSLAMTKVKFFVYGRRRQGYDNYFLNFRHGQLIISFNMLLDHVGRLDINTNMVAYFPSDVVKTVMWLHRRSRQFVNR